ncbi:hypothetical protein CMK11_16840 [Candidatus Poribacteria bacterium]|nr:hypothetical protein [Candidatus Poribacteria bacterium]
MRRSLTFALVALLIVAGAPLCAMAAECAVVDIGGSHDCCAPPVETSDACESHCELAEAPAIPSHAVAPQTLSKVAAAPACPPAAIHRLLPAPVAETPTQFGEPPPPADPSTLPSFRPNRGPPVRA